MTGIRKGLSGHFIIHALLAVFWVKAATHQPYAEEKRRRNVELEGWRDGETEGTERWRDEEMEDGAAGAFLLAFLNHETGGCTTWVEWRVLRMSLISSERW